MGLAARRRLAVLVPWAALAAVTVFALVQMRARHEAERQAPGPATASVDAPPPAPRPDPASDDPAPEDAAEVRAQAARTLKAARAAGNALDAALKDLEVARAERNRERLARRALETKADGATAALAAAQERLAALEKERSTAVEDTGTVGDQERQALQAQVEMLKEKIASLERPPVRWMAEAESGDALRLASARREAAGASEEDVDLLLTLVETDPERADAAALLLAHLPASRKRDDLVVRVVTGPGGTDARVRRVGADALAEPDALVGVLVFGSAEVARECLRILGSRLPALSEDHRSTLRSQLEQRLRGHGEWPPAVALGVAAGLRLEGLAPVIAGKLGSKDTATRIAAAHALSRAPDLESVRAEAVGALPDLLMDETLYARIAALHLAEALLGRTVDDYDPAAGKAARREAVDRLLDAL